MLFIHSYATREPYGHVTFQSNNRFDNVAVNFLNAHQDLPVVLYNDDKSLCNWVRQEKWQYDKG